MNIKVRIKFYTVLLFSLLLVIFSTQASSGVDTDESAFMSSDHTVIENYYGSSLKQSDKMFDSASQINLGNEIVDFDILVPEKYRQMGFKDVLSVGHSNFMPSSKSRLTNIRTASKKFNGQIIPKGEIFSFNEILKSVHPRYGYVRDQIVSGGSISYALGGGVCQLSTSILRAALNAGLDIQYFKGHSLAIPYYKPYGIESAVYLPYLDLKFRNDTPSDIVMNVMEIENELVVVFYGTDDGRSVQLDGPYFKTSGDEFQHESQHGNKEFDYKKFKVKWDYAVTKADGEKKTVSFETNYRRLR